jgi:hypothetical protein
MNMKQAFLGALSLVASMAASAATLDLGQYTLTYDENTPFGNPTTTTGPGNEVSFSWSLGNAVSYLNVGPNQVVPAAIILPSYTVTANAGYSLSGPLTSFSGNVVYAEFLGNVTTMALIGAIDFDHAGPAPLVAAFTKTPIISVSPLAEVGTMSLTQDAGAGNFGTVSFAGSLLLTSTGSPDGQSLSLAAIQSRTEDKFKVSFFATPVPVPPAAWLFSSALVGLVLRRRNAS